MKSRTTVIVLLSLLPVFLVFGYAKLDYLSRHVISSGGVAFSPGDEWHCEKSVSESGLYPTRFVSPSGVMRVILLEPSLDDPQIAAAGIRTGFDSNPRAVRGSYTQETFLSESGLCGIHVGFRQQADDKGAKAEMQIHHYLVMNRSGRCVAINFRADAHRDAAMVDQSIRSTLKHR